MQDHKCIKLHLYKLFLMESFNSEGFARSDILIHIYWGCRFTELSYFYTDDGIGISYIQSHKSEFAIANLRYISGDHVNIPTLELNVTISRCINNVFSEQNSGKSRDSHQKIIFLEDKGVISNQLVQKCRL